MRCFCCGFQPDPGYTVTPSLNPECQKFGSPQIWYINFNCSDPTFMEKVKSLVSSYIKFTARPNVIYGFKNLIIKTALSPRRVLYSPKANFRLFLRALIDALNTWRSFLIEINLLWNKLAVAERFYNSVFGCHINRYMICEYEYVLYV